jgi:hypothetical protein
MEVDMPFPLVLVLSPHSCFPAALASPSETADSLDVLMATLRSQQNEYANELGRWLRFKQLLETKPALSQTGGLTRRTTAPHGLVKLLCKTYERTPTRTGR